MRKIFSLLAAVLFAGSMMAENVTYTGTIKFGSASGSLNVNAESVTGEDNLENEWTVTTTFGGQTSFTPNAAYAQIGSSSKPASTITFTTTLPESVEIKTFSAKFGGFNNTAGSISLKVGDEEVGTGALNAGNDVTVSSTKTATGKVLTVTVTDIAKGVKAYEINYSYDAEAPAVAKPVITGETSFFGETTVTISCETLGAAISYSLNGADPITNSIPYGEPFTLTESATVKAVAYDIDNNLFSEIAEKTFTKNPSFDSFEALVAAKLASNTLTEVNFEGVLIDSIYTSSKGVRQGIYINVMDSTGKKPVEIYYNKDSVPAGWAAGDALSGTIQGNWTYYKNGQQWEIVPSTEGWKWADLTCKAQGTEADAWTEIVFNEAVAAADLPADASFEFDGLHVAITDSENKMAIDGNKAYFGTADAYTQYAFRLKTGGKSQTGSKQNFITINVPEDGELRLAVRSGKNSDETRTLVLAQGNDTIYNAIVRDADAIDVKINDSTTIKVFPYVKVPVKAGNINVAFPVNGLNFYSFAFHANIVPPTPEHTYTVAGAPAALFGKEWNASFEENDMVKTPLDTYLWSKDSVALAPGKVEFKVVEDHAWAHAWPEQNYVLNIDSAGIYNVSIVFNPNADVKVSAVALKIASAEVLPTVVMHGTFFGNWADTEEFLVSEDKKSAAITLVLNEGTYEFGVKLNGVWRANGANITREDNSANLATGSGNMHITADVAGAYEFVYTFASERLDVIYPAEPKEGVEVSITEGVRFVDNVEAEGWWQIMAENDKFIVSVSNVSTKQLEGVYTIDDLDKDFTYLGLINANDTAFVSFIDGSVTLTLNEQAGSVTVAGTLLGNDSIKYNLNLVFTEPKAKETVNVNITNGKILDDYAADGLYGLYGADENNVFVIISVWAKNGLQGEFTENDLDFNYLGSGVIDQEGSADIYKAAITVTPGNGDDYSVTATLLCYNNKQYNVTMYIPASQGIEDVDAAVKAVKRIINDQLIIEKNGRLYNATGTVVR